MPCHWLIEDICLVDALTLLQNWYCMEREWVQNLFKRVNIDNLFGEINMLIVMSYNKYIA